ncbi:MAG: hypothetical protein IPI01_08040 [Ignavibacteriae bacterium]|nr:hypothetical protein [Ignavibacteriota bacterium]
MQTIIRYDVPANADVKIVIYDILGREVNTLVNGVQVAGRYSITWNASGLATGVYLPDGRPSGGWRQGLHVGQEAAFAK